MVSTGGEGVHLETALKFDERHRTISLQQHGLVLKISFNGVYTHESGWRYQYSYLIASCTFKKYLNTYLLSLSFCSTNQTIDCVSALLL